MMLVAIGEYRALGTEDGVTGQKDAFERELASHDGQRHFDAFVPHQPQTQRKDGQEYDGVLSTLTNPKSKLSNNNAK
jgi:hypothetical protein